MPESHRARAWDEALGELETRLGGLAAPGADDPAYLQTLRLQELEQLDLDRLSKLAGESESAKLKRAARSITALARAEDAEYRRL